MDVFRLAERHAARRRAVHLLQRRNRTRRGRTSETYRKVFNTGVEVSFKASRLWTGATNSILDMDGLRHIIEPSVELRVRAAPEHAAAAIAAVRFRNCPACCCCRSNFPITTTLIPLTARTSSVSACATRCRPSAPASSKICWTGTSCSTGGSGPTPDQRHLFATAADLQRPLFRPDVPAALVDHARIPTALRHQRRRFEHVTFHQITFTPNDRWSWGLGHWYLRSGFLDTGDNFITSTMFLPAERQLGLARHARFQRRRAAACRSNFTRVYRDFRSWTGALTFRVQDNGGGPTDYTVAFSFSHQGAIRATMSAATPSSPITSSGNKKLQSPATSARGLRLPAGWPMLKGKLSMAPATGCRPRPRRPAVHNRPARRRIVVGSCPSNGTVPPECPG